MLEDFRNSYERDGYVSPLRILDPGEAARHRAALETAEAHVGPLHYKFKAHTFLRSPFELATRPAMLDLVEALLGPNILLYNVSYIIKEPHTSAHVCWHQDLAYWGLSSDAQVSAWLALSPATPQNGCMRMIPGSHKEGRYDHGVSDDEANILLEGQTVYGVDETQARLCPLEPGEASFHHGWTLHASMPNESAERRIGLNIQYLATDVRQTLHNHDSALLVRGVDNFENFEPDIPAVDDLEPDAVARQSAMQERLQAIYARAT